MRFLESRDMSFSVRPNRNTLSVLNGKILSHTHETGQEKEAAMIFSRPFGHLADGRNTTLWRIGNQSGEYVELVDYGAVVHSLCVRDGRGRISDVVLGAPTIRDMEGDSFKAATIGRCANRIAWGQCVLGGMKKQLETGRDGHFLHGGSGNYAYCLFRGRADEAANTVHFYYTDTGAGGFGDRVDVTVSFTWDDSHRLTIRYRMVPERETILCPTNHAYFNLGSFTDIRRHCLTIHSKKLAARGASGLPEGGSTEVSGTAYDFSASRIIQEAMCSGPMRKQGMYDDVYLLDQTDSSCPAAVLACPEAGRTMQVYTDMPALILFTPPYCDKKKDKSGKNIPPYGAVCLEAQFVPNAVNCHDYVRPVFQPGECLESETAFVFGITDSEAS